MNDVQPTWKLKGTVLVSCNCDYGCPCNFNARPSRGKCEGGWTWHIERGAFDGVALDGLNFSVYANWPGAIHEGNGQALILVDERANDRAAGRPRHPRRRQGRRTMGRARVDLAKS